MNGPCPDPRIGAALAALLLAAASGCPPPAANDPSADLATDDNATSADGDSGDPGPDLAKLRAELTPAWAPTDAQAALLLAHDADGDGSISEAELGRALAAGRAPALDRITDRPEAERARLQKALAERRELVIALFVEQVRALHLEVSSAYLDALEAEKAGDPRAALAHATAGIDRLGPLPGVPDAFESPTARPEPGTSVSRADLDLVLLASMTTTHERARELHLLAAKLETVTSRAIDHYREAFRHGADDPVTWRRFALALADDGRDDHAFALLDDRITRSPRDPQLLAARSLLEQRGR